MNDLKLKIYSADFSTVLPLPVALESVAGGFPSPAEGYLQETIDLNRDLIQHPATTFYIHVQGESMRERGIDDGDLIVVDRAIEPKEGDVVLAVVGGEFTIKTIHIAPADNRLYLMPANPKFRPIEVLPEEDFKVWGVVTYTIKQMKRTSV